MSEIGMLLYTKLNDDVINIIYNKLVNLKTISVDLKEDIITYSFLISILTNFNEYDEEEHNMNYIFFTLCMFNMIIRKESIDFDLETDVKRVMKRTFLKYSPQERKEYIFFLLDNSFFIM